MSLGKVPPIGLHIALSKKAMTDKEATRKLREQGLPEGQVATIRTETPRSRTKTEIVDDTLLYQMQTQAIEAIKFHPKRSTLPNSIDARLMNGLLSLVNWADAKKLSIEKREFTNDGDVASQITEYGCVIRLSQAQISDLLRVNRSTLERGIRFLKFAGIIIATDTDTIFFDPRVVWRGSIEYQRGVIAAMKETGYLSEITLDNRINFVPKRAPKHQYLTLEPDNDRTRRVPG